VSAPLASTEFPARAWEWIRWRGPGSFLLAVVRRLLRPIIEIQRHLFVEADMTEPLLPAAARVPLDVRLATLADFEQYEEAFRAGGVSLEEARRRHERGDVCIIGLSGAHLAGFNWLTFSSFRAPELDATVELEPGDAFGLFIFTLPAWRGKGIHPALASHSDSYLYSHSYKRLLFFIVPQNRQSLKATEKLPNRRRTKTVWAIRLLGMRRPLLVGAASRVPPALAR